jgi:hypothetical protein
MDELWDEIARRHEICILLVLRTKTESKDAYRRFWHGGICQCIGLLDVAKAEMVKLWVDQSEAQGNP